MEFPQEANAFADCFSLHVGDYASVFGANGRSKPFRVKIVRALRDVVTIASRHAEILPQS